MRKLLYLLLIATVSLTACSKSDPSPDGDNNNNSSYAKMIEGTWKSVNQVYTFFNEAGEEVFKEEGLDGEAIWTLKGGKITSEGVTASYKVSQDGKTLTINDPEEGDQNFEIATLSSSKMVLQITNATDYYYDENEAIEASYSIFEIEFEKQ